MIKLSIMQVGAGGTGSWFARTLAQMLCQFNDVHKNLLKVHWGIYDYDVIEKRNLLRQPFLAGIGTPKAIFLAETLKSLFDINGWEQRNVDVRPEINMLRGEALAIAVSRMCETARIVGTDIELCLIVSCVDNTYTRTILEETIAKFPQKYVYYVNMGVSPEGDWYAERIDGESLIPTKYDELSYPDAMLSCGQRAETTPVPQTTYSNIMAGAMAAHMVNKLLGEVTNDLESNPILCIEGKDFTTKDISELYLPVHIADVAAAAQAAEEKKAEEISTTTTENVEEHNDESIDEESDLASLLR